MSINYLSFLLHFQFNFCPMIFFTFLHISLIFLSWYRFCVKDQFQPLLIIYSFAFIFIFMMLFLQVISVSSSLLHIFYLRSNIYRSDILLALSSSLSTKHFLFIALQYVRVKTLHFWQFYSLTINFRMFIIFLIFSFAIQLILTYIPLQYFFLSILITFASPFYGRRFISEQCLFLFFGKFQYWFLKFYFLFLISLSQSSQLMMNLYFMNILPSLIYELKGLSFIFLNLQIYSNQIIWQKFNKRLIQNI